MIAILVGIISVLTMDGPSVDIATSIGMGFSAFALTLVVLMFNKSKIIKKMLLLIIFATTLQADLLPEEMFCDALVNGNNNDGKFVKGEFGYEYGSVSVHMMVSGYSSGLNDNGLLSDKIKNTPFEDLTKLVCTEVTSNIEALIKSGIEEDLLHANYQALILMALKKITKK